MKRPQWWQPAALVALCVAINAVLTLAGAGVQALVEVADRAQSPVMLARAAARLERAAHDAELKHQHADGPRFGAAWQVLGATAADHAELLRARAEQRPYAAPSEERSNYQQRKATYLRNSYRVKQRIEIESTEPRPWHWWATAAALAAAVLAATVAGQISDYRNETEYRKKRPKE